MHSSDFEAPPLRWSLLSIVGGVVTAIALIIGVEISAARFRSAAADADKSIASPALQGGSNQQETANSKTAQP
ncbi:MAG: hypothetical protein AB8B99_08290 [Phormidesmis sp.]